ncbi:hypothetical protein AYO22_06890 [Fonsecaea multimorphosa]|nr:hypothetical protein AYO22_06890 [Fonsecaea multimorphosa]
MEALAAFGLACNVIQVVDASWKAFDIYTQFRERGTTARADELRHSTQHLVTCNKSLQDSLSNAPAFPLLPSGVDFTELTKNCIESAEELGKELEKIKLEPGSGRFSTLRKAVRANWKSDRIEELKRKLDNYARALDSTNLVHLSQNLGTLASQQTDVLTKLDDWQQKIYAGINDGNTSIKSLIKTAAEEVKAHTSLEHNVTRLHIDRKLDDFADNRQIQAKYESFMENLYFQELNHRQDTIADAHAETFEWIFDSTSHIERPWNDFLAWTQDDDPLYWVLGKAGSGKSTLMNFLVQDARTRTAFERKFTDVRPLIITFFFWEAGVDLQKTELGLLRSIIWQILNKMDAATSIQIWSNLLQKMSPPMPTVWALKQLRPILQSLVQAVRKPDLSLPRWSSQKLRLQDLTESDITVYVKDKLVKDLLTEDHQCLATTAPKEMSRLIEMVVKKAEGVFLWVRLTVESLVRGIRKDDDWQTLQERLEQMSHGIFELYEHMWKRMELDHPHYAREAAAYLQYVRHDPGCSLVELTIACDERLQNFYLGKSANWDLESFGKELDHERLRRRVLTRCAGFLEIHEQVDKGEDRENAAELFSEICAKTDLMRYPNTVKRLIEIVNSHYNLEVWFLHRTALEYLETESGKKLLQAQPLLEHEIIMTRYRSALVLMILHVIIPEPDLLPEQFRFLDHDPFQDYLDNHSKIACAMFVQLEEISEKLKSLGVFSVEWIKRSWPVFSGTENLDYIKAFLPFSHPAYTEHRLRGSGLIENRHYLTDLLRSCVSDLVTPPPSLIANTRLLLRLGADPNQKLLPNSMKGDQMNQYTIWAVIVLWMCVTVFRELLPPLLSACIKAGADLNSWIPLLFSRKKSPPGYEFFSNERPMTYDKPFMLVRIKACDLVHWLPLTEPDLLHQAGAISEDPYLVAFAPPNAWISVALDAPTLYLDWRRKGSPNGFYWPRVPDPFQIPVQIRSALRDSERGHINLKIFNNGIDALRTAGLSDNDIRELPISQTIWEVYERGRGAMCDMVLTDFWDLLRMWDEGIRQ